MIIAPGDRATWVGGLRDPQEVHTLKGYHSAPPARAGFWRRVVAALVDWILVNVIYLVFFEIGRRGLQLGLDAAGTTDPSIDLINRLVGAYAALWLALIVVYIGFFTWYGGQTPGKMLMHIRVVDRHGTDPTVTQAFLRPIGYLLSWLPLGLGFVLAAFPEKRALHDFLTGTRVVHTRHDEN